jgi:hypothetical protein
MASGANWTGEENAILVRAYLDMLELELSGERFSKAEFNRRVGAQIQRTKGSIEYKLQNVSQALLEINHPWIDGYKPARNLQDALRSEVLEQLESRPTLASLAFAALSKSVDEPRVDFVWSVGSAPRVEWSPKASLGYSPRRVDFVRIDAENHRLGRAGELAVLRRERQHLAESGRPDLAERVEHVSETQGDGTGFDILSFDVKGEERFIEVKTTRRGKFWPMLISRHEVRFSQSENERFALYRVHDFGEGGAGLYVLKGDVAQSCQLSPVTYQAVPA